MFLPVTPQVIDHGDFWQAQIIHGPVPGLFLGKIRSQDPNCCTRQEEPPEGLFICIGGMNGPDEFVGVRLTIKAFFDIIDCQYSDVLLIGDMDTIRDVAQHPELLEAVFKKGQALGASLNRDME